MQEPKKAVQPKSVNWAVGQAARAVNWAGWMIGGAMVLAQLGTSAQQWRDERAADAAPLLAAMRAEQAWLVEEGLASGRRITIKNAQESSSTNEAATLGGWRAMEYFKRVDALFSKAGLSLLSHEPVIEASLLDQRVTDLQTPEDTYRHEEGHARVPRERRALGSAAAWPKEAAAFLSARMSFGNAVELERGLASLNWRDRWLLQARAEAFADAFGCLSKARAGAAAYREMALGNHALRVFGDMRPKGGAGNMMSSLLVVGEGHAVDMASFLAGQLDPEQVARLDSAGLDDLSGQLADASLAWMLARQGGAAGFFSGPGKAWWEQSVTGSTPKAWEDLKNASLRERPKASFGGFEFRVGGETFKAQGLPSPSDAPWRFDGFGGTVGWAPHIELGADGPVAKGQISVLVGQENERGQDSRLKRPAGDAYRAQLVLGGRGALWTHWALAWRMGADMDAEAQRAQKHMGDFEPAGQAKALFESWTRSAMKDAPKLGAKLAARRSGQNPPRAASAGVGGP